MFREPELLEVVDLLVWRREQEADGHIGGWYEGRPTRAKEHNLWFERNRERIRMWVENDDLCGMVRVDSNGELSFYVPHDRRGRGVEQRMLRATHSLAEQFGGRLKATVDEGNTWAWQALREAGFREYPVRFLAYKP